MSKVQVSSNASGTGVITLAAPNTNSNATLTLPTASGTINTSGSVNEVPAGTVSAPAITTTGDTNTGIFFPAADTIAFTEGGVESMRINSSGNVGIGTASPATKLHLLNPTAVTTEIRAENSVSYAALLVDGSGASQLFAPGGTQIFNVNGAERMRLDSSGNLLVGTTSVVRASSVPSVQIANNADQLLIRNTSATAGLHWRYTCDNNNTVYIINQNTTGVYIGNGGTSWVGLSDERHKDIIEPISNAAEKVLTLRAVIGKFKTDDEGIRRSFLIAQDVQKVLPEAVHDVDPERLGLSYTDVIPLLVAAIQEQQALIQDLTARLEAVENK